MIVRLLDLDESVSRQTRLCARAACQVDLRGWGPLLRIACRHGSFRCFEEELARRLEPREGQPTLTFIGSGDFHHVSLALLRRQSHRCNVLVLDKHPDWMRGVPILHCGTWLNHAARLPQVERVYHVGGDLDFDNAWRFLAPWPLLRAGKIQVISAIRRFAAGAWQHTPHTVLRRHPEEPADVQRIQEVLAPYRGELSRLPLYVSLDRDVLRAEEAVVNWDSGCLMAQEALTVLAAFVGASAGLVGMDVTGDWSEVRVSGMVRRGLDWWEHPRLHVDRERAARVNEALNLEVVGLVEGMREAGRAEP